MSADTQKVTERMFKVITKQLLTKRTLTIIQLKEILMFTRMKVEQNREIIRLNQALIVLIKMFRPVQMGVNITSIAMEIKHMFQSVN